MAHYDYLIVGSGLYGATFAYRAKRMGKKCLVIDKRSHLGGNVYCEQIAGIWSTYFPYLKQDGVEFCELDSRIQSLYKFAYSKLQGRTI